MEEEEVEGGGYVEDIEGERRVWDLEELEKHREVMERMGMGDEGKDRGGGGSYVKER